MECLKKVLTVYSYESFFLSSFHFYEVLTKIIVRSVSRQKGETSTLFFGTRECHWERELIGGSKTPGLGSKCTCVYFPISSVCGLRIKVLLLCCR